MKQAKRWKVGDVVFKPRHWLEDNGIIARPTPDYWTIIGFGHTKDGRRTAHLRHSIYGKYNQKWVLYDELAEREGSEPLTDLSGWAKRK